MLAGFTKNTKKALTSDFVLTIVENMMIKTYTREFDLVGLVAQRSFCAIASLGARKASHDCSN